MRSRLLGTTVVAIHSSALSRSFERRAWLAVLFLELFSPEFEMRKCCHKVWTIHTAMSSACPVNRSVVAIKDNHSVA